MSNEAEPEIEIPATIKLKIPWKSVIATLPTVDIIQQVVTANADIVQEEPYIEDEDKLDIDYEQDITVLKVRGYALMPGRFTGMNGLTAEYDHDVIKQDGLDIVGRPVGEMHEKSNSGYVQAGDIDEITAKLRINTEIYDADAIQKVNDGTYTGYSIDTKVWGYKEKDVFLVKKIGFKKGRVDLVDKPACKDCLFQEVEDANNSAAQQTLIQNKDEMEMAKEINISKEEYDSLLKAKADMEQAKIEAAAEKEVKKVQLIEAIKGLDPTFNAAEYLLAATAIDQKLSMLTAYEARLNKLTVDEEVEDIKAPKTGGADVTQGLQTPPEIELTSLDAEQFIKEQFEEFFLVDLRMSSMYEDFNSSLKAVMGEESRTLVNLA